MKKLSLILILVLGITLIGFAENPDKTNPVSENTFQIRPKLFWSSLTPIIFRQDKLIGLTVLGFDGTLLKYKKFHFLSVGGGLETYYAQTFGWHTYVDYYGYRRWYHGMGYEFQFEFYFKFVPVKWHWDWASKLLKIDSYLEIGLTNKKEILVGLTFGNPFKKQKTKKVS